MGPAEMINVDGNKIFWRLAEIYLLRAEARCRANLPGAEDDLNYVEIGLMQKYILRILILKVYRGNIPREGTRNVF